MATHIFSALLHATSLAKCERTYFNAFDQILIFQCANFSMCKLNDLAERFNCMFEIDDSS